MHCNEFRNNLTSYLDNELSTEEKKATLAHEEGCVDCSTFKKEYQDVLSSLKTLSKVKTSPQFEKILLQKLQNLPQESFMSKISEMIVPSSMGIRTAAIGFAALLLVVSGSYLFYNSSNSGVGDGMPVLSSPSFIEKKVDDTSSDAKDEAENIKSVDDENTDEEEDMNTSETEPTQK